MTSPSAALVSLIEAADENIAEIGAFLDGLSHADRLAASRVLDRAQQRRLFEKAAKAPPLKFTDFVPEAAADLEEIIHHGRNTLPLLPSFKLFEKRMCRPQGGGPRVFGFNESPTRGLIGPGYFVMIPTAGNPAWEARGSLVVDYFQVPEGPVSAGWPEVKPNSSGLQVLVYNKTRDFMRKVSAHMTIGAAYKVEKALGHYFVLVRAPIAAAG